jgi:hypothetical protein
VSEVWAAARAGAGWEPADWEVLLRRRRRRQLLDIGFLVALVLVAAPVVRWVRDRPPNGTYWVWVVLTLVLVGRFLWSRFTADGRYQWDVETRREIRIEHALREHVSIGHEGRGLVTERAELIRTWSWVAFVGLPVLGVAVLAGIESTDGLSLAQELAWGAVVIVVCAGLLLLRRRRYRLAVRWLADPLPRGTLPR